MSAENPTLEDFGFDSRELMIEVQRETMGKLIKAEAKIAKLRAALEKCQHCFTCGPFVREALANEQEGK
jgi:hypothetical protein